MTSSVRKAMPGFARSETPLDVPPTRSFAARLAWFAGLWLLSVVSLGVVATFLRWIIR